MKKKKWLKTAYGLILVLLICLAAVPQRVHAATLSELEAQQKETEAFISSIKQQQEETNSVIAQLQDMKNQSESQISTLNGQSSALTTQINDYISQLQSLSDEMAETEELIRQTADNTDVLNGQMAAAENKEENIKKQLSYVIKTMYEKKLTKKNFLFTILTGGSLHDIFARAEYFSSLVQYQDRKMEELNEVEETIADKTEQLEKAQEAYNTYHDQLSEKTAEVSTVKQSVQSELGIVATNIQSEKNKLSDYDNQLAEMDAKMQDLQSQVAEAQVRLAKQIAEKQALMASSTKEDTSGAYAASASELELLAATIQAEADGESYTGKLAVGSVIMNRVKSSSFPDSIYGVVTQSYQFASYTSGKVDLIISNGANSTCRQAAQEVLDGARVGDYLFFMTQYYADYYGIADYTMIGNHAFFYRWETRDPEPEESVSDESGNSGESDSQDSSENIEESSDDSGQDDSDESYESADSGDSSDSGDNGDSEDSGDSDDNGDSGDSSDLEDSGDSGE